jgi:hypothetical protein
MIESEKIKQSIMNERSLARSQKLSVMSKERFEALIQQKNESAKVSARAKPSALSQSSSSLGNSMFLQSHHVSGHLMPPNIQLHSSVVKSKKRSSEVHIIKHMLNRVSSAIRSNIASSASRLGQSDLIKYQNTGTTENAVVQPDMNSEQVPSNLFEDEIVVPPGKPAEPEANSQIKRQKAVT